MKSYLAVACAFFVALPLSAAAIDGQWLARVPQGPGAGRYTISLRADGSKLTGGVRLNEGIERSIEDGKIDGDHVSFKQVRKNSKAAVTFLYEGTLTGNRLDLTRTTSGGRNDGTKVSLSAQRRK